MANKTTTYIFHITRKDGTPLILHNFSSPEKFIYAIENTVVVGRYGKEPRVETLTMFRNELYRLTELAIKNWIFDQRFIPKFLISTAVFLVSYFFLSYVIRDPIPYIDETILSIGAAVFTYIFIGKRDMNSIKALHRRVEIRNKVDKIEFRESAIVRKVESLLHKNESSDLEEILESMISPVGCELNDEEREEALQFIEILGSRFNSRRLKKAERRLKRFLNSREDISTLNVTELFGNKGMDFPLYAVYKSFKKTVSNKG